MSLCINPVCSRPHNPDGQLFCQSCESELLLEGRYQVLAMLGEGGCGKTYEVGDRDGISKVLKVLSRSEPKYIELFRREATVLSQLSHPGIPAVEPNAYFAYLPKDSTAPLYCLVMEKITGLDLQKYLRQRGSPIGQGLAVQWLIQLATILKVVHGQQFLHRDIKPSNIMLKSVGHLVLIDFGTVRSITKVAEIGEPSTQGTRIMSALYTPMEQMKGKAVPQSDFFALGRTFVYLLTGQDLDSLYDAESDVVEWRHYVPALSEKLADFIDQLMAPLISQRPANADIVLEKLYEIQREIIGAPEKLTSTQMREEAPTLLAPHRQGFEAELIKHAIKPALLPQVSSALVERCKQELAEFIGPIAGIVCQRTLAQNAQLSEDEFIEALVQQISSPKDAIAFRQRLSS
jgi:eukaryotic-like serine/threonine-protein kinase